MKRETRNVKMPRAANDPRGSYCQVSDANRILSEAISAESKDPDPPKGAPLCSFLHPDSRPCGSPAMRKSRAATDPRASAMSGTRSGPYPERSEGTQAADRHSEPAGLCYQHGVAAPARVKRETRNAKRSRSAQAELDLTPIRRLRRSIDDRRQRIRDLFWTLPPFTTPAAIDLALDHIDRAHAAGVFDDRAARLMRRFARIAQLNLKSALKDRGSDSDPATWPVLQPPPPLPTRWKRAAVKAAIKKHYNGKGSLNA